MRKTANKSLASRKKEFSAKARDLIRAGKEKMEDVQFQPIWKKVKKGLGSAVEALGKGTEKAAGKAATLAAAAGVKYKIYEHHHKLHKLLAELGGMVYDTARRNPQALSPADPEIIEMIGKITDMENKITALEEKAKELKKK